MIAVIRGAPFADIPDLRICCAYREHEVFGVKVYVDNAQQILKSGMSATVRLE